LAISLISKGQISSQTLKKKKKHNRSWWK